MEDYTNETATVMGWGRLVEKGQTAAVLKAGKVPVMSTDQCRNLNYKPGEVTDNMMCAGYLDGRVDACQVSHVYTNMETCLQIVS